MFRTLLLAALFNACWCARPSCLKPTEYWGTHTFDGVEYVPHNTTYVSVSLNKLSCLLPDPYMAHSGQTVRQKLYMGNTSNTLVYPVTPPMFNLTYGNVTPGVYNTSFLPVFDGLLVHTYMNRFAHLDNPNRTCQEPFGVVFGTTFEQDRIAMVIIAPGEFGMWGQLTRPNTTYVHVVACSNATVCAYPMFNRWGPAGSIHADDAFVEHNSSCFLNDTFEIPMGTSRVNLAFRFQDGNLLLYHTAWLPTENYTLSGDYPLRYARSVGVGSNLPFAQFFQSVARARDSACAFLHNNLYIAPVRPKELLVKYNDQGMPVEIADCSADSTQELYCITGTFTPSVGVYQLSRYRAEAKTLVQVTQQEGSCAIPYTTILEPPSPAAWVRATISNCTFDFESLLRTLPTYNLKCYGISPARLSTMCYAGVTLDIFKLNTTHLSNMLGSVPDAVSIYNYALPSNFYGCVHAYHLNSTTPYAVAVPPGAYPIKPGGRQLFNSFVSKVLDSPSSQCTPANCMGVVVIGLTPASGSNLVCPKANDTQVIEGQCVKYNFYGYAGTGVINQSDLAIPNNKLFVTSKSGAVLAVRAGDKVYSITPCVSVPISVGYDPGHQRALVFNGLDCSARANAVSMPASEYWTAAASTTARGSEPVLDTPSGCVYNVNNCTTHTVSVCEMPIGNSLCLVSNFTCSNVATANLSPNLLSLVVYDPTDAGLKVLTPVYWVSIPTNFTLAATTEYIQTTAPKVNVDCVKYLCGDSERCIDVLSQYGAFCEDVNKALADVSAIIDSSMVTMVSELTAGVMWSETPQANVGSYNFSGLMGCLGSNCQEKQYRSAISDLLYNKVKVADPGFMGAYQKCIDEQWGGSVRDLICTQTFNGISVLPPIVSPGMQALYTSLLVGAVASSGYTFGITSVGVIPFATQLQFRLNGLGVTTNVLMENQKLIANAFNNALTGIQKGFDATNMALAKMQSVINKHAQQLSTLVDQLGNSFGAISSSINEIFSRLDELEANAQVDRLINGRMVVLNTYVTQLLIRASEVKAQAALASQKISECVKAQSQRNDFCGNGTHVLSIPQMAPNGVLFLHYSYQPTAYNLVRTAAGLCFNDTGYVPLGGLFVLPNNTDRWLFTKMSFYDPVNISVSNTQVLAACGLNYSSVNYTVLEPAVDTSSFNFTEEFEKWYVNQSHIFNNTFNASAFNFSLVDVNEQLAILTDVVNQLNQSYIDLKQLGTYEYTVKWPWYVWLGMIAGLVGLVLAVVLLLCMTNCCSCARGVCSCKSCAYEEHEDVYPAVRVHGKRTA
uniref:Spike protein n=1 Tax=Bat Coronavirus EsYN17 TaxID=3018827 RepID=A0AA49EFE0_9NIDO|nr:spike protein [Bat Coronavirus EsYN17]